MPKTETKAPSRKAARLASDKELKELYQRVGRRLGELQDAAGLSQRAVCEAIFGNAGLQSEWSRWRRGVMLPNIGTLHQIAKYFGVSLAGLGLYEPEEAISAMQIERAKEHMRQALAALGE